MKKIILIFCMIVCGYGANAVAITGFTLLGTTTLASYTYFGAWSTYLNPHDPYVMSTFSPLNTSEKTLGSTKESRYDYKVKNKERQYIKKYKKKYILTKDSPKECDDDKNPEVCYRYARIFNLLKYEEEAKKYYDLSCKYGLDIACDINMQEDLNCENTTNYLKEYSLDDEIKDYDMAKQKGKEAMEFCRVLLHFEYDEMLWWSRSNVGLCYAGYEYALEHNDTHNIGYYKRALCMYGYEKYCDKAQDK